MTLVSEDNERIRANKVVLACASTPSQTCCRDKNTYYDPFEDYFQSYILGWSGVQWGIYDESMRL